MIITEDYFLDAKKELEKYSNLLSILNLEDFICFVSFYVSGFENNILSISKYILKYYILVMKKNIPKVQKKSPNKNNPYVILKSLL